MEENISTGEKLDLELVEGYLDKIKQLLRYTKGKDDIIAQLGKDLQHYRDGFTVWAFKPFILALIDFRESCKKDITALSKYSYDVEKIKKNINYLFDDLAELLLQNGVEENDGEYFYNGHNIAHPLSYGCENDGGADDLPPQAADEVAATLNSGENNTLSQILESYHNEFVALLSNNCALETTCLLLAKASTKVDANNKLVYIYPALKKLIKLSMVLTEKLEVLPDNDDEAKHSYGLLLEYTVAEIEGALELLGCTVLVTDDVFNTTQHRLLKPVLTDDESLDRSICTKLTDAYTFEGKVIYLQKVEVYKFKK